jgi:hypothetical protein
MWHAPSVIFPVGRCPFWALFLGCFALVLAGVLALGWGGLTRWQVCGLTLSLLAWCVLAARAIARQPIGWLRFSGGAMTLLPGDSGWAWQLGPGSEGTPVAAPRIVLDLQQRLLLQVVGARGVPRWIWLEAVRSPADWLALRRALLVNALR